MTGLVLRLALWGNAPALSVPADATAILRPCSPKP